MAQARLPVEKGRPCAAVQQLDFVFLDAAVGEFAFGLDPEFSVVVADPALQVPDDFLSGLGIFQPVCLDEGIDVVIGGETRKRKEQQN